MITRPGESDEIGIITTPPVGDRFALAGGFGSNELDIRGS